MKLEIASVYSWSSRRSQTCNINRKRILLPCKHRTHQGSGKEPLWSPKERGQSKQWRRSARLQTGNACHSSQSRFPGPGAPTEEWTRVLFCTRTNSFCIHWGTISQRIKQSYWDGEGFFLVVEGHASGVASLGQHAIKIVFTAGREEPKTPNKMRD